MTCGMMAGCGGQNYEPTDALYINSPSVGYITHTATEWLESHEGVKLSAQGDMNQWFRFRRWEPTQLTDTYAISEELQAYYDETQMAIMKGKASDIIEMGDYYWYYDVEPLDYIKMAKAGAFVDLYDLFEKVGFDTSKWNRDLMDKIAIDGKLYFIPRNGDMLIFTTTRQTMEESGFPFDANDDIMTFLRKCVQWKQAHPDGPDVICSDYWTLLYRYWYAICGLDVVNFDTEKVNIDTAEVKELLAMIRALKPKQYNPEMYEIDKKQLSVFRMEAYEEKSCLFSAYELEDQSMMEQGDSILVLPMRHADGTTIAYTTEEFFAIPSTSKNIYNAGSLLSHRFQEASEQALKQELYPMQASIVFLTESDRTNITAHAEKFNMGEDYEQQMLSCYENLGVYLTPQSWNYTLDNYMQDYYADKISVDELTRVLQEKMEIYITE